MSSSKVAPGSRLFPASFDPVVVTGGAVSAWFSLSHPSTVITGSGYSSVADVLDPSNPATQGTDADRPANQLSNNGLPIMSFASSYLTTPLTSARNGATHWGCAGWVRYTGSGNQGFVTIFNISGGASASKVAPLIVGTTFECHLLIYVSGNNGRRATSPSASAAASTWLFLTYEYDANGATEADRNVISIGGVAQTLGFTDAGSGGTTGALVVPTGNMIIGGVGTTSNPLTGLIGPNLYLFGSKMAGATAGLLTPAARTALMNYQQPT